MRQLNAKIETFLMHKTALDALNLPQNYPAADKLEEFQIGLKFHGWTKESLTGNNEGDFKDSWYVICSNYFDDPFFVDFIEEDKGFPVYFAFHGAGGWTPIKISENIEDFSNHLIKIKLFENEKEKVVSYLTENLDIKNEFWKVVFLEFTEINEELVNANEDKDWEDWILGKIIITDIGPHKLKIVNILKTEFKLTPQDALSLSKQNEIEFKEGYLKHLKFDIKKLNELGATAIFKPNENGLTKLKKNRSYHIKELIEIVKNKLDRDVDNYGEEKYNPDNYYYVYISKDETLNGNSVVYVGKTSEIDDDDNEIYPNEVLENNLEFCYSCANFQAVIDLAYEQKSNASTNEFIKCLDYYSKRDTFLDLNNDE